MTLPSPRDNQFLFLDMNAFFASCEQHRNPSLRGKPVGIAPALGPSACIVAASYEAKKYGITTGWRVGDAQKVLPDIHIMAGDHRYYVNVHNQLLEFLYKEISPDVHPMSVDEFGVLLDATEQWTLNAHALGRKVKEGICDIFSPFLQCSVGIAPNMFLAKLGTEIHKPNGLVVLQQHTLAEAYKTLQLRDLPGINWGMSKRLHALGIRTPLAFYEAPQQFLHDALGILGDAWYYNLHGYNLKYARHFHSSDKPKSVSHSHVLAPDLRTKTKARAVLYKLWIKVADRLRAKQLAAGHIHIMARSHTQKWTYDMAVQPTQNVFTIFDHLATAYDTGLADTFAPKQLLVVAHNLAPYAPEPLSLFPDTTPKVSALFTAAEKINHTFGRWTIKPASLLPINDAAPNRVTFQKPDYEMD